MASRSIDFGRNSLHFIGELLREWLLLNINEIPQWAFDCLKAIMQTVKLKDPHTFYHCCRVAAAARLLGRDMGLNDYEQDIVEFSGLLHDIGKVGIADNILLKPSSLTIEEIKKMKEHPELSCEIIQPLMSIPFFRFLVPGIRYHHEKWDGSGYGHMLEGEKIPLNARIISVVDTVDAMTHQRPYRKALSLSVARHELVEFSGTQFDRNIVKVYLEATQHWERQLQKTPGKVFQWMSAEGDLEIMVTGFEGDLVREKKVA